MDKIRIFLLAWLHLRSQNGPVSLVKRFSYKDLKKATDGFRRTTDNSSRGSSYKARFQNGVVSTIKEVEGFSECDDASFYREVQLLGRLHHRHIVALRGFSTGPKRYLVFENVERGSLKEHLSDPLKTPLNWRTRLQIVVGIAAALEYLHFFCDPPVYHVSISSSTIMLDENLTPKIIKQFSFALQLSDISLIRSAGNQVTLPNSSSCIKGQTCKNIIFQLGLLILELITGQSSERNGADLVQWVQKTYISRSTHEIMDPDIGNNYDQAELQSLLNVARLCIKSLDKPKIYTSQILWYLQKKVRIVRDKHRY
ncbi:probable receptor-like protein kinase At1g49730 isoform X2 [Olea europaea var. sylvestris]|uniref:probable receptor-like protein kinase At1g49730 isoform X2 n=1 Tax=Olea europaea var. sylvestris TaxID=158386 RepID=UPI000C1D55E0|nr:probable receptor-like protein kinase At1g49730 isoform X2 [Olea europaea var. sylvestris]